MSAAEPVLAMDQLSDEQFRATVRAFIETNYPAELRNSPRRLHYKDTKGWYQTLSRKGWLCPNWPKQFGGMGISASKQLILLEEKERHGCARLNEMGMTMLGSAADQAWDKRAAGLFSAEDSDRRSYLVPGLQRAECRVPISHRCARRRCSMATNGW